MIPCLNKSFRLSKHINRPGSDIVAMLPRYLRREGISLDPSLEAGYPAD